MIIPFLIIASIGTSKFNLEIAKTMEEKNRGLMHRSQLPSDEGMIFEIESESPVCMWMKNTNIPLDMIFLNDQGIVMGIVENAQPQTLEPRCYQGDGKIKYVIEILGGMSKRAGLKPLDKIDILY